MPPSVNRNCCLDTFIAMEKFSPTNLKQQALKISNKFF